MGYSVVNNGDVGFSKGARVYVGPVGAGKGGCRQIGLLGADATLSMEKTFRSKSDHFPEVEVASAVQALTMTGNLVVREWNKLNLMLALDVAASDVTDVPGTPDAVTDVAYTPVGGVVRLPHVSPTNVVVKVATPATLVLNTDYQLMVVNGYTHVLRVNGSTAWASDTTAVTVSYDFTPVAHTEMPLGHAGARQYYEVWFEEELTTSATAKTEYRLFKAAIGLDGNFNFNSAESGADLPLVIQASLLAGQTELGRLYHYA